MACRSCARELRNGKRPDRWFCAGVNEGRFYGNVLPATALPSHTWSIILPEAISIWIKGEGMAKPQSEAALRGLWRLMLKLPAVRGRLQIFSQRSSALSDLFEAYEDASSALERFQRDQHRQDGRLIQEYETVCVEIETEVIRLLLDGREDGPN